MRHTVITDMVVWTLMIRFEGRQEGLETPAVNVYDSKDAALRSFYSHYLDIVEGNKVPKETAKRAADKAVLALKKNGEATWPIPARDGVGVFVSREQARMITKLEAKKLRTIGSEAQEEEAVRTNKRMLDL